MTEVLGIIPARKNSKSIKNKNIKLLGGRPLVQYTFDAARSSKRLTRILLTTDSPEIARLGKRAGIEVPFLRPGKFAKDSSAAKEYVAHCLEYLEKKEKYFPEIVVILQPTTPFRRVDDIDACIDKLLRSRADSIVSVTAIPAKYSPEWQLTIDKEGRLRTFTGVAWSRVKPNRQQLISTYVRNGAVYAFRRNAFVKTHSLYGNKVLAHVMPEENSVNIDYMEDWCKAEDMLERYRRRK